jgi:transcriptional regulator with XRE-family HTH domain
MLCCVAVNKLNPKRVTPKARALGAALREAREGTGRTLRQLAAELGRDHTLLSRWENGQRVPKSTDVAQVLTVLGVIGDRYDEIVEMAEGTDASLWVAITLPEQRQHQTALLDFEDSAAPITTVSPLLIPGLAQDDGYVRAIMSAGGVPADEVATRVAVRIGRQAVITRRNPAHLVAVIGEAALRHVIGNKQVMVDQLEHLLKVSELPNVDLRVMDYMSGWQPALEGPFTLIDPRADDERATIPVVQIENRRSGLFLHEPEDVDVYRQAADAMLRSVMSPAQSVELITEVITEMRTE